MRSLIVTLFALTSSAALAAPNLSPIDGKAAPSCSAFVEVPADAKNDRPAFEQHISFAHCAASSRLAALTGIADDEAGMKAVQGAIDPSVAMLDEVIKAGGEAHYAIIAEALKAQLYVAAAVRMRNTIPGITMTTVGEPLADHDRRHAALEPKIKPWLDQAAGGFDRVKAAAASKPELANHLVVKAAVDAANVPAKMGGATKAN
jgi:hypothetical protein